MLQDVQSLKTQWTEHVKTRQETARKTPQEAEKTEGPVESFTGSRPWASPNIEDKTTHLGTTLGGAAVTGAAGAALAGIALGSLGLGLMNLGVAGMVAGGVAGLAASTAVYGAQSGLQVTASGIEEHWSVKRDGGDALRTHQFTLPDGTVVERVQLSLEGGEMKSAVSATSADGRELKAELARDGLTGRDVIRFTNDNGALTQLDPAALDLTFVTPREVGSQGGLTQEFLPQKQTVHADGSMDFILHEESAYTTRQVPDPLRRGESKEETTPRSHTYRRLEISAAGDTRADAVEERFGPKIPAHLDGRTHDVKELSTGMSTSEEIRLLDAEGNTVQTVSPFLSRDQMAHAHEAALQRQVDELLDRLHVDVKKYRETGEGAYVLPGHKPGHTLITAPDSHTIYELSPDGKSRAYYVNGGVALEPLQGEKGLYVLTNTGKLTRVDYPGWEVEVGKDVLGPPSFDADGKVHVVSHKGERLVARTVTPDGEMTSKLVARE